MSKAPYTYGQKKELKEEHRRQQGLKVCFALTLCQHVNCKSG